MIIDGIEITKREVIASITIIALMVILGIFISNKIYEASIDEADQYNKAVKIDNDTELFIYGMRTNVGNALVYGKLTYDDVVTFEEIGGKYIYVTKITEEYTKHTEVKTRTDDEGNTETYTETYYSWDEIDSEIKHSKRVKFCGEIFDYKVFKKVVNTSHIKTKYKKWDSDIRYVYYGYKGTKGTSFCNLKNNTMDNLNFYNNSTIEQTMNIVLSFDENIILFWICWVLLIGIVVYVFCALENKWLE